MAWKAVGNLKNFDIIKRAIDVDNIKSGYPIIYGVKDPMSKEGDILEVQMMWTMSRCRPDKCALFVAGRSHAILFQTDKGRWVADRSEWSNAILYVRVIEPLDNKEKLHQLICNLNIEKANLNQQLDDEKVKLRQLISDLKQEKADLNQQKKQQGRVSKQLDDEKVELRQLISDLNWQTGEQQRKIESLLKEKVEQQHTIRNLNETLYRQNAEQQRSIELLIEEKAEQQHTIATLNQEKADLNQQTEQQGRVIEKLDQSINNLDATLQTIGGGRVDMEQLKIEKARLEERCNQSVRIIHSKEQEIKSLKGELDDMRRFHDRALALSSREDQSFSESRWQRIPESDASQPLSIADFSWVQVRSSGATDRNSDDAASLVSVDTMGRHCWMKDALFKKVTDSEESYVEAHTLVEGSLVRAANGNRLKVACPPKQYETDAVIWLYAAGAKLPLTPNHRVPIVGGGDKPAKDLQKGDVIFVSGQPAELTLKEEISERREVVQISFVPDDPIPAFMAPPSIDTKGHKKKPLRRSMKSRKTSKALGSEELKTEGYYTD